MKTKLLLLLLMCSAGVAFSQSNDEQQIRDVLYRQTQAWNKGDLEGYMETYWKSDSLMFLGKKGVAKGWERTLQNYKKGYPDTAAMGKLAFDIIHIKKLSKKYSFVIGKWMLKRSIGDVSGYYTLLLEKKKGKWLIIVDHTP